MGDYNMVFDKLHSDADLEEVQRSAAACAAKNEREQQAVDALFMERQECVFSLCAHIAPESMLQCRLPF